MGFQEVWVLDFEYVATPGNVPSPVCLVAVELGSGRQLRLWEDELQSMAHPPYATGADVLFVGFYASAEWGCHLALGWPLPVHVLDLFIEFRNKTNGGVTPFGNGLLGAMAFHGLDGIEAARKDQLRSRIIQGGPWTGEERAEILDYCASDVEGTARLLRAMAPSLDWGRALLRGQCSKAVARMEHVGVPIDVEALERIRGQWEPLKSRLIADVDGDYGVYDGQTFKRDRWEAWLLRHGIPWPRLPTGALDLKEETFREMSRAFPAVGPLKELRATLGQLRLMDLAVGTDGRNRTMLSPFRSKTGRNQPSNTRFIFGPSVWVRGLIRPREGWGLAYVDWSQQEFGIAAALSQDAKMQEAYRSGDPYLAFAKQAGAVPQGATKKTHSKEREQFKACVLAVQYGMGQESLAARINQSVARARELLALHRQTYRVFWQWSDGTLDYANLQGHLWTVFGWRCQTKDAAPTALRNFLMQANGAEMLRLACCLGTEAGVRIVAPVHDAVLVEAPLPELDATVVRMQGLMVQASAAVLGGFELASDVKVIRWPDRYTDERGAGMWGRVQRLLGQLEGFQAERASNATKCDKVWGLPGQTEALPLHL